jgi:hypothetical protein
MATESREKEKPELTGRRYQSVEELLTSESISDEVRAEFAALEKADGQSKD